MQQFWAALLHCGLVDLGFKGNLVTWVNDRTKDDFVQERLDKACATIDWRDRFPQIQATHLEAPYSDHIPILITTQDQRHVEIRKNIYIYIYISHKDFRSDGPPTLSVVM